MKRFLSMALAGFICLSLVSCGKDTTKQGWNAKQESSIPDLIGEWKQVNNNSEESWQSATIEESTITVYWVSDHGDTKSLYWAGTFEAPAETGEPYSWVSINDTEQTSMALLASGDDEKTFTYEDGQISYEVSALGTTTTVRLERE